jgi:16S rRNA (guanine(966)-N(2))-methyltransferase RsmD
MRITGGVAGGRQLKVPKGLDVRPTPDRVKQAIFNSLGERILGARVLELFAGSGALSLESLSRGATSCECVEKVHLHADFIRRNILSSGFAHTQLIVRVQDVFHVIPDLVAQGKKYDLIFADPPYGEKNIGHRSNSFAQRLLDLTELPSLLSENGIFVLGHARRDEVSMPDYWHENKCLKHGDSLMRLLSPVRPSNV